MVIECVAHGVDFDYPPELHLVLDEDDVCEVRRAKGFERKFP